MRDLDLLVLKVLLQVFDGRVCDTKLFVHYRADKQRDRTRKRVQRL